MGHLKGVFKYCKRNGKPQHQNNTSRKQNEQKAPAPKRHRQKTPKHTNSPAYKKSSQRIKMRAQQRHKNTRSQNHQRAKTSHKNTSPHSNHHKNTRAQKHHTRSLKCKNSSGQDTPAVESTTAKTPRKRYLQNRTSKKHHPPARLPRKT